MRRRQKARRQPLVFLRSPQCGGRSIEHALEAAGHTLAIPLAKQNPGRDVSSASQSAEEVEPDGLDFSQLGDRDDADLQQLILPEGSTLAFVSRSFPAPGQLARCPLGCAPSRCWVIPSAAWWSPIERQCCKLIQQLLPAGATAGGSTARPVAEASGRAPEPLGTLQLPGIYICCESQRSLSRRAA